MTKRTMGAVYTELGFGSEFEGRPVISLRKEISDFRKSFVRQGNEVPKHARSPAARNCALAFCLYNESASRFWKADGPGPRWPADEDK